MADCHCPDRRKAAGSAREPFAGIKRDQLRLTRGGDQLFLYGDIHGHDVRCQGCASLLYLTTGLLLNDFAVPAPASDSQ